MQPRGASVFQFHDYRSYLHSVLRARKEKNRRFSLGAWAQRLDLASSSTLIMILKGSRNPSGKLIDKLIEDMRLPAGEAEYFRNLVHLSKSGKNEHLRHLLLEKLAKKNPARIFRPMSLDVFRVFSSWVPTAIRELADLPAFREDSGWIQSRLLFKTTRPEIEKALQSLLAVGLLKRDDAGKVVYDQSVESTYDVPSESQKQFHESALKASLEAVRAVDVKDREISGFTFTIRKADLPVLKEKIRTLLREASQISTCGHDSVYHLEVACIPLTKDTHS
ncbi:MAG: TIGR02147 family protein [Bdellovibrionota bacterium]